MAFNQFAIFPFSYIFFILCCGSLGCDVICNAKLILLWQG